MSPKYKLTYFPVKVLAEPIRFLLSYGKLEFEDVRVKREDWPELKSSFPFGQLPVLEVDGKVINQSIAIARYLAKQVKLNGSDDWENLEIDSIVDTLADLRAKIASYSNTQNTDAKESLKQLLFKETLPFYLSRLDAIAEKNNGHLACGKLTWADFVLAGWIDQFNYRTESDLLKNYPNLRAVIHNVMKIPEIKAWCEKRPPSDF